MWKTERKRLERKRRSIWQSDRRSRKTGEESLTRRGRSGRADRNAWIWFLLPSFLGVSVFVLVPFLDVVRRSFLTAVTEEWTGTGNYRTIFANQAFRLAVYNTARFTAVCLPLLIGLGLFLAVQLSKLKKLQLIKSMFLFPLAMPAATVVLIWKMLFSEQGFLNGWMMKIGVMAPGNPVDYMGTKAAFWVLVFSYIWKNLGYTIVLWLAGIFSVSADLTEAAKVDGANERQCFFCVVFPNLKGSLYTITVLSFLNSFKVFREAYLVAGSYPHESMYLLQHLFNNWFVNLELDKMAAAAVCVGTVLFLVILLLQKLWDQGGKEV